MKNIFTLIFSLCFVWFATAQQKTTTKKPTTKTQAATPSLEETLEWIKEKVEKYIPNDVNSIHKVSFNWNGTSCILIKYDNQVYKERVPDGGNAINQWNELSNMVFKWEFDLCDLDVNSMTYVDDNTGQMLLIKTIGNSRVLKRTFSYHYLGRYWDKELKDKIEWEEDKMNEENRSELAINIYSGEINLIERMKKALQNAISKCPKKSQSNEKF